MAKTTEKTVFPPKNIFDTKGAPAWVVAIAAVISAIIGFLAASILYIFEFPQNPSNPLDATTRSEQPIIIPTANCTDQTDADLQSCCKNWAESNELAIIECVGEWTLEEGKCTWQCQVEN